MKFLLFIWICLLSFILKILTCSCLRVADLYERITPDVVLLFQISVEAGRVHDRPSSARQTAAEQVREVSGSDVKFLLSRDGERSFSSRGFIWIQRQHLCRRFHPSVTDDFVGFTLTMREMSSDDDDSDELPGGSLGCIRDHFVFSKWI